MSSQVPPDPITDTFNPSAWNLPELSPEEEAVLDANYVKYPIAQNRNITFPGGISTSNVSSTGTGASNILEIGVASRTVSGAIHHYSDGDNCVAGAGVHLNNGTFNNSTTNIHNGTGINASGTVNIMSGSANSGTITIGNETTNNTTLTLRGNTTITKPTISQGITPIYTYPIITNTQIGYTSTPTLTWQQGVGGVLGTTPSMPIGLYAINWCVTANGAWIQNFLYLSSSTFSNQLDAFRGPFVAAATNVNVSNSILIFNSTVARTFSLVNFNPNTQAFNGGVQGQSFSVTRIA